MKTLLFTVILSLCLASMAQEQTEKPKIYNPEANAQDVFLKAVEQAKAESKHVLIQVGGNWCPWCIKLHKFVHENQQIDSLINADYVFVLINYSKENKNLEMMQKLDFPQRFGFPVLVVVDQTGKRIHTQDTGLLEDGEGYSTEKISRFLQNWNVAAIEASRYQK